MAATEYARSEPPPAARDRLTLMRPCPAGTMSDDSGVSIPRSHAPGATTRYGRFGRRNAPQAIPAYRRPQRSAAGLSPDRRASSTIPATTNGATSHGVCLIAMARPISTGPRQATQPRWDGNRSQPAAAPIRNGRYSASVTPPVA